MRSGEVKRTLNPKQAKGFLATFILIGGISILEMISVLVDDGPVWLRWIWTILSISTIRTAIWLETGA